MTLAERMLSLFRGREDHVAVSEGGAFHPETLENPLPAKWLEKDHLAGKRCYGFYLLTSDSQCHCTAVDFDNKPDEGKADPSWRNKAEVVYYELTQLGLSPLVEISQSGQAAHVWLFFSDLVDAWIVRRFWAAVSESSKVPFVEVYPRQDVLTGKGLGNLIRYPLFGESRFVDVEHDWKMIDPEEALSDVRQTDAATLGALIFQLTGQTARRPEAGVAESGLPRRVERLVAREHSLLGRRWRGDMEGLKDPSRSALCQSIACELVRQYVPTPEVESALVQWCQQNDYDKGEREEWIGATVGKAYDFVVTRDVERVAASWTMADAVQEFIAKIGLEEPHLRSGLAELDASVDGVASGEMCVIAARPSHGKTAFAMHWLDSAAFSVPCLFISEEMARLELAKRALLRISELEVSDWGASQEVLASQATRYYNQRRPIYGIESVQSIDEAERQIAHHCELHGVKLVAVDYLQLLNSKGGSRYEDVSDISKRLKQAALRNRCAVLALCQLNREIEKRDGRQPKLSDLRESGQIEQDADLVLFLDWPFRNDADADPERYLVWCGKRRNGPIRSPRVETTFNPERQLFGRYQTDLNVALLPGSYADIVGK